MSQDNMILSRLAISSLTFERVSSKMFPSNSLSKSETIKFKQKVYQMNLHSPVMVVRSNNALREFSSAIKPDEDDLKGQRRMAQQVVEILQSKTNFKIGRTHFAGSVGKKTNVQSLDIDLICLINDKMPPYQDVKDDFYSILKNSAIKNDFNIEKKKHSIQLTKENFKMDVVPGTNFVKVNKRQSIANQQIENVLQRIKENPDENFYKFSASLAEATVQFMKTRVGFANEMARICKQWYKSVKPTEDYISGGSTFIELVAVFAARRGQRGNRKFNSYLKCYIRFLEFLINFEQLNVAFNRCNPVFKAHLPSKSIPRVIDPVNPYNNYINNWSSEAIQRLKQSATITYQQLQGLILNGNCSEEQIIGMLFKI